MHAHTSCSYEHLRKLVQEIDMAGLKIDETPQMPCYSTVTSPPAE
jgi:hypothetical protein